MTDPKIPKDETLEEATRKGYLGSTPDDTPNEAYTVAGVTGGAKTPETEPNTDDASNAPDAEKARKR